MSNRPFLIGGGAGGFRVSSTQSKPVSTKSLNLGHPNTSKYVDLGNNFNWGLTTAQSYSFWMKITGNDVPDGGAIVSKMDTGTVGMEFHGTNGIYDFGFFGNGTACYVTLNYPIPFNTWTHVVCTNTGAGNAAGLAIYVNGSLASTTATNTVAGSTATTAHFNIGYRPLNSAHFPGLVDEVCIWTKSLSSTEVATLYHNGKPLDPKRVSFSSSLTSYYKLGDVNDSATTIYDQVGSVNGTGVNLVSGDFSTDVPPEKSVWTPARLPGLALWLDASDSSTMTLAGSLISAWQDKSLFADTYTATGTARPTLTANALNGKSGVTWNGSSTVMLGTNNLRAVGGNAGWTVAAVVRNTSALVAPIFLTLLNSNSGLQSYSFGMSSDPSYSDFFLGSLESSTALRFALTAGYTAAHRIAVVYRGGGPSTLANYACYDAGTAKTPTTSGGLPSQSGTKTVLGAYTTPWNEGWGGDTYEIVVCNAALSASDLATLNSYLSAKWV